MTNPFYYQRRLIQIIGACLLMLSLTMNTQAQDKNQIVRIAKLKIDSSQLKLYNAALKEEIETSIRVEPGVLTLYAVAEKKNPAHITILEIYANTAAYKSHIETVHFKKYKTTTKDMVKSLELVDTDPIILGAKKR